MKYVFNLILGMMVAGATAYAIGNFPEWHAGYIVQKVGLKTFRVVSPANHGTGGTGFVVAAPSGNIYTITNAHVCELAENGVMHALVPGKTRAYALRVLEASDFTDLCLLEAVPNYTGVPLADSAYLGEEFAVVGHPLLMPLSLSKGTLTANETISIVVAVNTTRDECSGPGYTWVDLGGTINSLFGVNSACKRDVEAIYTTAEIFPGNSGSPAVNFWGNLIGVVFAGDTRTNYGYIIPLKDVCRFLSIY